MLGIHSNDLDRDMHDFTADLINEDFTSLFLMCDALSHALHT